MTKVEAIKKVLEDTNGVATWEIIYKEIKKYYSGIDNSTKWKESIRGVLYRELKNKKNFKKIGLGIFALLDYNEMQIDKIKNDSQRMHSYIEGICIELGNIENYNTYTADPSAKFNDILLKDIVTIKQMPNFTYSDIISEAKRIDVIWFNKSKFAFPKIAYEVVDSIGTMENAFSRTFQLSDFKMMSYIVGKKKFKNKYEKILNKKPFNRHSDTYQFIDYDRIISYYKSILEKEKLKFY